VPCQQRDNMIRRALDAEATAGKQGVTRHCPARLGISPRSACVYRHVIMDVLLRTQVAQELLAWR